MKFYKVIFLSPDSDDFKVYKFIDFGSDKKAAWDYCISHDWKCDGMLLDIVVSYDFRIDL